MILWKDSVTDRSQSNVTELRRLLSQNYDSFSDEDKRAWKKNLKGALNVGDLYRIKNNIEVLRETLELDIHRVELGSNLIPYPYDISQASKNGLMAQVNDDGSITVSGTASADTNFIILDSIICKPGTRYYLSGCPVGGSASSFCMRVEAGTEYAEDYGSGVFFEPQGDFSHNTIQIKIRQGTKLLDTTFWPMLCWTDESGEYDRVYEKYRSDRDVIFPKAAVFEEIQNNVAAIREAYSIHANTPEVPARPFNSYQKWNDIEAILEDVYQILMDNFNYIMYAGGEVFCGEGIGLLI